MSLLSSFNNILDQFLAELVMTFPELNDLRTIQTVVSMIRSMNARLVLDNFMSVAGRYHVKILTKQASFFEDLSNWESDPYFQSEFAAEQSDVFQKLVVFKDVWVSISEKNKSTIWTYMRQLLIIGARANTNAQLNDLCQQVLLCAKDTIAR